METLQFNMTDDDFCSASTGYVYQCVTVPMRSASMDKPVYHQPESTHPLSAHFPEVSFAEVSFAKVSGGNADYVMDEPTATGVPFRGNLASYHAVRSELDKIGKSVRLGIAVLIETATARLLHLQNLYTGRSFNHAASL